MFTGLFKQCLLEGESPDGGGLSFTAGGGGGS